MRKTVRNPVIFEGKGLHSGKECVLTLHPGRQGLVIQRGQSCFTASWDNVVASQLSTLLRSPENSAQLSTVEHLMAALYALGITDVLIECDSDEVPILDGSSLPFILGILDAGMELTPGEIMPWVITEPVIVKHGEAWAGLFPADRFSASFNIDFTNRLIGSQSFSYDPVKDDFTSLLAPARTFCMASDIPVMRRNGLALGGDESNAVIFGEDKVENRSGLRYSDEPVRHKLLDALGDLHLAGAPIIGRFEGNRSGHRMTNDLLRKAFSVLDQQAERRAA